MITLDPAGSHEDGTPIRAPSSLAGTPDALSCYLEAAGLALSEAARTGDLSAARRAVDVATRTLEALGASEASGEARASGERQ